MSKVIKAEKKSWFYSYNMIFTLPLSCHAKLLYVFLCRCADEQSRSFPGLKTIAKACGMGVSSVQKSMLELIGARLLIKEANYRENGSQTSNTYMIFPEPYSEGE